ncbi:TPA: hypothetical protein ACFMWO_002100, partial [Neisseria meningitidis]
DCGIYRKKQQPLRRHSRAGGNPDLGITVIFKDYKRPVIPAQAGIQTVGHLQRFAKKRFTVISVQS